MIKTTSQLVAQIESGGIPYAMRYEAKFTPSPDAINKCIMSHKPAFMSRPTAEVICKTSWGVYQIMGENLYTICGLRTNLNVFINNTDLQEEMFQRFLEFRDINYTLADLQHDAGKLSKFARRYNGSSDYALKIKQTMGW